MGAHAAPLTCPRGPAAPLAALILMAASVTLLFLAAAPGARAQPAPVNATASPAPGASNASASPAPDASPSAPPAAPDASPDAAPAASAPDAGEDTGPDPNADPNPPTYDSGADFAAADAPPAAPTGRAPAAHLQWNAFVQRYPNQCSGAADKPCRIPNGVSVIVTGGTVKVRSLFIDGTLLVQPSAATTTIDAAFVVARGPAGSLTVKGANWNRRVTFYLRRNPAAYNDIDYATNKMLGGGRVLAAYRGGKVDIAGQHVRRTWTLLTKDVGVNNNTICVADDIRDWPKDSAIAIAPTDDSHNIWGNKLGERIGAQVFRIGTITPGKAPCKFLVTLNATVKGMDGLQSDVPVYQGSQPPVQGEVMLLNRSVVITGDPFSQRWKPLEPPPWINEPGPVWSSPWATSTYPVEGLHTLAVGVCQTDPSPDGNGDGYNCKNGGGWMKMTYVRVEKGGQRGWIGRYPLHLHKMGDCPQCKLVGNVVTDSQQRGIVIHSTHRALIDQNVVFGVKGAGVYIEEGTEVDNMISNNAIVCDIGIASYTIKLPDATWADAGSANQTGQGTTRGGGGCQQNSNLDFGDPSVQLGGCRVTGTDNEQADCAQQAGIWALSTSNNFVGNRVANHYNGIYFQSTLFKDGRIGTDSLHRVCPIHSAWGKVKGNVVHSNQRFGFYPDVNYPNAVKRSVATNGYVSDLTRQCTDDLTNTGATCSCRAYTSTGASNSQRVTVVEDGIDWGNGFVGQYDLADVQYLNFTSINNNWGMYWKGSKAFMNFASAHIKNSVFQFGAWPPQNRPPAGCREPGTLYTNYLLSPWSYHNAWGVSLVSLPGASTTIILENVQLKGVTGVASWLEKWKMNGTVPFENPLYLKPNGGQGAAININQQCKFFAPSSGLVNPLGELGYEEGALCTPVVYLMKVDMSKLWECPNPSPAGPTDFNDPEPTQSAWINIGAANGNSYLGAVVADDDSLCGGYLKPCPIRAVVSKYSTHLLNLPGKPCHLPYWTNWTLGKGPDPPPPNIDTKYNRTWFRRFTGNMICEKPVRRFNLWGHDQGKLLLVPPVPSPTAWEMNWLGFGVYDNAKKLALCWGTFFPAPNGCSKDEERRWAEGYGAMVMSSQALQGRWLLKRADGKPVDLSKIRMIEFSDQVFGPGGRFKAESFDLAISTGPGQWANCTLKSTDQRLWMSQFGPVKRGGGSCLDILNQYPMATP